MFSLNGGILLSDSSFDGLLFRSEIAFLCLSEFLSHALFNEFGLALELLVMVLLCYIVQKQANWWKEMQSLRE